MMGSWMLVTGLASLFAGDFSGMIPEPTGATAAATNPGYARLFAELGLGSLAVGVALVVLIPFLRKTDHRQGRDNARGNDGGYRRSRGLKRRGRRGTFRKAKSPETLKLAYRWPGFISALPAQPSCLFGREDLVPRPGPRDLTFDKCPGREDNG